MSLGAVKKALVIVVILGVIGAGVFIASAYLGGDSGLLFGLMEDRQPPEFEQVGESRYEVVGNWSNPGAYDGYNWSEIETLGYQYTNEARQEAGLNTVEFDEDLSEIARSHSEDMAEHGYIGHVDSSNTTPPERVPDHVCSKGDLLENAGSVQYLVTVDKGNGETRFNEDEDDMAYAMIDNWINSPTHRENLLAEDNQRVGIGVYVTRDKIAFTTQLFCQE